MLRKNGGPMLGKVFILFLAFVVDGKETHMIFRLTKLMITMYIQLGILEKPAIT